MANGLSMRRHRQEVFELLLLLSFSRNQRRALDIVLALSVQRWLLRSLFLSYPFSLALHSAHDPFLGGGFIRAQAHPEPPDPRGELC